MSEIDKTRTTAIEIIKTLEDALKNVRTVHCQLGRVSSPYKGLNLVTSEDVSKIVNKDSQEVDLTLSHKGIKKYNIEGESYYNLADVLTNIKSSLEHTFSLPTQKRMSTRGAAL